MASRLNGDDEKSILEDAKTISQFMKQKRVPPLKSNEKKDDGDEAYRKLLKGLNLDKE